MCSFFTTPLKNLPVETVKRRKYGNKGICYKKDTGSFIFFFLSFFFFFKKKTKPNKQKSQGKTLLGVVTNILGVREGTYYGREKHPRTSFLSSLH